MTQKILARHNYQEEITEKFPQPDFNMNSQSIRSSTLYFPKKISNLQLPLVAFIQPYGEVDGVASFNASKGILRCNNCRAYVSYLTQWTQNHMVCHLCQEQNQIPDYYQSELDENQLRVDRHDRVELNSSAYDIKAGQEYMMRPPVPPTYFFLIDVSQSANKQILQVFQQTVKNMIESEEIFNDDRTQIGFLSYDNKLHYYSLEKSFKVVVCDENPFPNSLLFNVKDKKEQILNLLDNFVNLWEKNQSQGTQFYKAIEQSVQIMKQTGGKLFVFQFNSSVLFEDCFKYEQNLANKNNLLRPSNSHFSNLVPQMHNYFISPVFFIFQDCFRNLINLQDLVKSLNGFIYNYQSQAYQGNLKKYLTFIEQQFLNHLQNELKKYIIWESVFRIRFSKGWIPGKTIGNYSVKSNDLLSIFNCDQNHTLMYQFEQPINCEQSYFAIQTALLYTNSEGERRIRVHNYALPLTNKIDEIYQNADCNVLASWMFRTTLDNIYSKPDIKEQRTYIFNRVKEIFKQSQDKQVLLQFMQACLGFFKHPIFCTQPNLCIQTDKINCDRFRYMMMPVDECFLNLVPYLFELNQNYGYQGENFIFPNLQCLSSQYLGDCDYLLHDGVNLLVFQNSNLNYVYPKIIPQNLPQDQFLQLCYYLQQQTQSKQLTIKIVTKENQNEFLYKLIEDKVEIQNGYAITWSEFNRLLQ